MSSTCEVVVEIPRGSQNKYEFDEATGTMRLDRVLYSAVHYPTDYGFIPHTRGEDGDALDALLLVTHPTFPGCHVESKVLGVLYMSDENGQDEKILLVPTKDPRFSQFSSYTDLPPHTLKEIENFFATYKILEKKETDIGNWEGPAAAWKIIEKAQKKFAEE